MTTLKKTLIKFRYFWFLSYTYIVVSIWPFILNYYVTREMSFADFYKENILGKEYKLESLILFSSIIVLYFLTKSCIIASGMTLFSSGTLAFFSHIKFESRSEMLNYSDLKMTQSIKLASEYLHIEWDKYLITLLLLTIFIFVVYIVIDKMFGNYKDRFSRLTTNLLFVILSFFIAIISISYIQNSYREETNFISQAYVNKQTQNYKRYVIYHFFENESIGFDAASAQNSLVQLLAECDEDNTRQTVNTVSPNIIILMNESWWDTDKIPSEQISFSSDPMLPYKSLANREGVSLGYVSSNVYGGGSVSSEAEFLTGLNTKYFTTSSGIYNTISDKSIPTIVDYFNALDYQTVGIHPYYYEFYNRNKVYPRLNFDKTIFHNEMMFHDIYTKYISDDSLVSQIIYEYESTEKPIFVWASSLGNHRWTLPYEWDNVTDYDYPIEVDFHGNQISEPEAAEFINYINGVYYANLALTRLIGYFEATKEPTVILMYGDHIFDFSASILSICGFERYSDKVEMQKKLYTTPVALWTNCTTGDFSSEISGENINLLSSYVFDAANLPDCVMTKLLRNERNIIKADTRFYVLDSSGNPIEKLSARQSSTLLKFESIQYDIMIGDCEVGNLWLPLNR